MGAFRGNHPTSKMSHIRVSLRFVLLEGKDKSLIKLRLIPSLSVIKQLTWVNLEKILFQLDVSLINRSYSANKHAEYRPSKRPIPISHLFSVSLNCIFPTSTSILYSNFVNASRLVSPISGPISGVLVPPFPPHSVQWCAKSTWLLWMPSQDAQDIVFRIHDFGQAWQVDEKSIERSGRASKTYLL